MAKAWGIRLLLATTLLICQVAVAQSNPIEFASEVLRVSRSGHLAPATSAVPGDVIEYRVYATNTGRTTLPAGTVQILGPVPEDMRFVPGSATPSSRRVLSEYATDGTTFSVNENRTASELRSVRSLRWTLLEPMEPGAVEVFVYRIVVGRDFSVPDWALASLEFDPARFLRGTASSSPERAAGGTVSTGGITASSQGFQVVSYVARWEGERLVVVGEVRNVGNAAAGVELQITARDTSGRLVDVVTFWPASIDNIAPGMTYGFRRSVTRERSAVSVDVKIVGARIW